jgi:hypothetical protein
MKAGIYMERSAGLLPGSMQDNWLVPRRSAALQSWFTMVEMTLVLTTLLMLHESSAAESRPPRAARSVHLGWGAPDGEIFYNEMTVEQSTAGSYFMAVGWNTGYFGIQELHAPTNKVVIFSVWDPTKGDNPNAVPAEQRVEVLHSDPGVRIKRFGGEGTGGQSMWSYNWRIGETNRFCLRATVQGEKTAYAAYFFLPEQKRWKHLATFRTATKGSPLKGYYSFVEDFRRDTKSVGEVRRARFGNGWVKPLGGDWVPLTRARFTASSASWEAKENINAGLSDGEFFLVTGGDTKMTRKLREHIVAPFLGGSPPDVPAEFSGKPGE